MMKILHIVYPAVDLVFHLDLALLFIGHVGLVKRAGSVVKNKMYDNRSIDRSVYRLNNQFPRGNHERIAPPQPPNVRFSGKKAFSPISMRDNFFISSGNTSIQDRLQISLKI